MTSTISTFGCYGFASLCTMTVSGKHPPTPSSSSSSSSKKNSSTPKPPQRRRRTRVPRVSPGVSASPVAPSPSSPSELARKYRTSEIGSEENDELIGGPTSKSDKSNGIPVVPPARSSSRFPTTWNETVSQLSLAVEKAARDGHERIRVDLKNPELIAPKQAATVSDKISYTTNAEYTSVSISASSEMISPKIRELQSIHRMKLLMQACNVLLKTLLSIRDELPGLGGITNRSRGPPKASLFFNTNNDRRLGTPFLDVDNGNNDMDGNGNSNCNKNVEVYTLGEGDEASASRNDITVLLCPCNTQGNPSHIEHVELVHYSNWKNHNLVVAINPALMALTRHGSLEDEPRQPSFLADYIHSYYIDPVAYIAKNATGAMLRCFPRKWEMYLLKFHHSTNNTNISLHILQRGFRLIGEANSRPSREKLLCEFSWRVNQPE